MKLLLFGISSNLANAELLSYFCYSTSYNLVESLCRTDDSECVVDSVPFIYSLAQNNARGKCENIRKLEQQSAHCDILKHLQDIPSGQYDHIIATGLRSLANLPLGAISLLKSKLKRGGLVCEFNDHHRGITPNCFTFVAQNACIVPETAYVGWAADPKVFVSRQDQNKLTIFVDHPHYVERMFNMQDKTKVILNSLRNVQNITIKRLANNGLEIVDGVSLVECYNDNTLPYDQYAAELSTSHIFIPTHVESMGLSVLEAGMAGALVVTHPGFIPQNRLNTVDHLVVDFDKPIDWASILNSVNPDRTRKVALDNNWDELAARVVNHLRG